MPATLSYPGIYIEELPSSAHTITASPTSVAVFVGYSHPFKTASSTFGKPIELFSFADYESWFGGFFANAVYDGQSDKFSSLAHAVNQFFLNGGSVCYVVGLLPKVTVSGSTSAIAAAALTVPSSGAGIVFTALEPTDAAHQLSITIDNLRSSTNTSTMDLADITLTYGTGPGSVFEKYRSVSLTTGTPTFIEKALGTPTSPVSSLVTVQPASAGYPTGFTALKASAGTLPDSPGDGGTVFSTADFTGVFQANSNLDKLPTFNLMVLPGVTDNGILSTASAFCERKMAFLIIDPPRSATADGSGGTTSIDSIVTGSSPPPLEKNCALYFPYLKTTDPVTGNEIDLPPSGTVAGIFARTDLNRGVWKAPAGLETTINNTLGVVDNGKMNDLRQGVLNLAGVNCLRDFPGIGTVVFGARTLVTNNPSLSNLWRYVPVRRMALFLEQTLYANLGWVVFEPNDDPLWTAIRTSIESFMLGLFRQGAFQGSKPSEAFLVKCDSQTTSQDDINNGIVNIVVAFAPLKPAEFVVIKIAQLAGQASS
jgi:phage tail sheath protein FI